MAMTLQQIRDFVRTHLDLEVDDLPDALLDSFIRDGSKRIERAESRWPFYEKTFTLVTQSGIDSYTKAAVSTDLDQIAAISVNDARPPLSWIGMDERDLLKVQRPGLVARPVYFTEWNSAIYLYPVPDQAYTLTIRGYRFPIDWVTLGAGSAPDMPDELHNTIATFALAKAYAQQEDPELAALYERQFNDELVEYMGRQSQAPYSQPLVLNGGPTTRSGYPHYYRPLFGYAGGVF